MQTRALHARVSLSVESAGGERGKGCCTGTATPVAGNGFSLRGGWGRGDEATMKIQPPRGWRFIEASGG